MKNSANNYAFIDSQNLNLSIRALGWKLDWKRFRIYLREKYGVVKAFLFIGYIAENRNLYAHLQEAGFICIFKPTIKNRGGIVKGNCDAELVLHAMIEYLNYEKAIIVSGDGDFYCLALYLQEKSKLKTLLIPNRRNTSELLKWNIFRPYVRYLDEMEGKLSYKKKGPREDETSRGVSFRS